MPAPRPASITLSGLSWSTPDGTPLFTDLNLTFGSHHTGIVGRNGTGKTTLLRLIAGELRPRGGGIHRNGSIGVLRQNPQTGLSGDDDTIADLFSTRHALTIIDRATTGQADLDEVAGIDWTLPARMAAALSSCGLSAEPLTALRTLSGGQRMRAALAALIFTEPDFLLLDEPTNNLDHDGRQAVIGLLQGWRGGAVVVSHDRDLLETMEAIVELSPLGVTRYGGNFSAYRARKAAMLDTARHALAEAEKNQQELKRRAQQAAERKARKDSAGHRARAKGGQPKILMDAAKNRAEASGGANARLWDARNNEAQASLTAARQQVEVLQPLSMDIPGTGLPPGKTVLRLEGVSGGYRPDQAIIRNLSLTVTGPARIAVTGPNGSGKTTLLALIAGHLAPQSGAIDRPVPIRMLDQHIGLLDPACSLRDNFIRLNPTADENQCRAALARFRFRAADALKTVGNLSGGERLRAGLACTLGAPVPPQLLLLDEPTNHLDLDAVEALENALAAYDGALLVVSHDRTFLQNLAIGQWLELAP